MVFNKKGKKLKEESGNMESSEEEESEAEQETDKQNQPVVMKRKAKELRKETK